MTRRIPAVILALGLTSALAQAQPLDWPDRADGTPASETRLAEPVASEAAAGQQAPGDGAAPQTPETAFPLQADGGGRPLLPPGRVWVGAEFLFWFAESSRLPPLLTTSQLGRTGALSDPLTSVVGGSSTGGGFRPGGRFFVGGWFDQRRTWGIEASTFVVANSSTSFNAASHGSTVLARPFVNDLTGQQDAYVLGGANSTGSGAVSATSDQLIGVNILLREHLCCLSCPWMRIDALGGYRFLHIADRLAIADSIVETGAGNSLGLPVGSQLATQDYFSTSTSFHGVDVGLTGETILDRFVITWVGKFALGTNHQTLNVNGNTTVIPPGGAATSAYPAGFLTGQGNAGSYGRQTLAYSPEFDLWLSYRLTPRLLVSLGYTFILWNEVARAPEQIDGVVNPTALAAPTGPFTGDQRPAFTGFSASTFWLQGLNLGLQYRF